MEFVACQGLAVPPEVMHHVVRVESSHNPFAIGVVGGRLVRQPKNLPEALSTVRMLESRGYNFSLGLAQVNRYNLGRYGLDSYEQAFQTCPNLQAGAKILAECYRRAGRNWGKSFSCYYSGNFSTGFRHGYVQKIYASLRQSRGGAETPSAPAIEVVSRSGRRTVPVSRMPLYDNKASTPATDVGTASAREPSRASGVPSRIEYTTPAPAAALTEAPRAGFTSSPLAQPVDRNAQAVAAPLGPDVGRAVVITPLASPSEQAQTTLRHVSMDKARIVETQERDAAFVF